MSVDPSTCLHCHIIERIKDQHRMQPADKTLLELLTVVGDIVAGAPTDDQKAALAIFTASMFYKIFAGVKDGTWQVGNTHLEAKAQQAGIILPVKGMN